MKPFNLEEYLKNPSQKVVTRDGREVRIVCTDFKNEQPILALIPEGDIEEIHFYYQNGAWCNEYPNHKLDLGFATIKREGWANIYRFKDDTRTIGCLFSSEEEAIKHKLNGRISGYIKTIKIEWEE